MAIFRAKNTLPDELINSHKKWVEEILKTKNYVRETKWSQSIAVGCKSFVEGIKEKLGIRANGRKVGGREDYIIFVKHSRFLTIVILPLKIAS